MKQAVEELLPQWTEIDIDDALERNRETFEGKFELQVSFLRIALEKYIHAESDRVIGAVTDVVTQGPYMKIKDSVGVFHLPKCIALLTTPLDLVGTEADLARDGTLRIPESSIYAVSLMRGLA